MHTPSSTTAILTGSARSERTAKLYRTAVYYAAFIVLGLAGSLLGPTKASLAENVQTSLDKISFLFTASSLGFMLGSFIGGRVYDRTPGHPVMAAMIFLIAVMMALVPLMPSLWLLILVMFFAGLSKVMVDVGCNTLLVWTHRDKVSPFMNGLHFFFGVGAALAPIFVAQAILLRGDFAWAYWALAVLAVPVAVAFLAVPSPAADGTSEEESVAPSQQVNPVLAALVAVFFFLYVGAEVGFGGWVFDYAVALNLANETNAAYLNSAFWWALTLGRLLSVPIATRVGPRTVLLSDLIGCLISVGVLLLFPASTVATWLGTLGLGFSMASVFPTTLSFAERRMQITGRVTGVFFTGASIGAMVLPWLIGQLFVRLGARVTIVAVLINIVLACGVFVALMLYSGRATD